MKWARARALEILFFILDTRKLRLHMNELEAREVT